MKPIRLPPEGSKLRVNDASQDRGDAARRQNTSANSTQERNASVGSSYHDPPFRIAHDTALPSGGPSERLPKQPALSKEAARREAEVTATR
jgi:hypothetical protein